MTHLLNESALKIDGALATCLYLAVDLSISTCKRACGLISRMIVNSFLSIHSADLGGSSNYSMVSLKTDVGKGSM